MRIGPYRILRQLGQGGQGTVYLGQDEHGGLAAVKVMTGGIDRAFAREVAAARQVAEFCTARVLRVDLDHQPPYVASEYIDGPALAAVAPVRGAALTRLAIGTATALAAIHRAGVVHRDFKPGNVLIGPDGPRVIDFGIARLVDVTATREGASGTPPYMAPEQFRGLPVGPASDVFAWGATMVHAANGWPPFGNDTFAATAYRILHNEPALGELREPLRGIVARCLAKDPALRPSARDLLLELLGERAPAQEDAALRHGAEAAHGGAVPTAAGVAGMPGGVGTVPGGAVPTDGVGRERPTAERGSGVASRRALLAGGVAAVVAAATTGVVLWRGFGTPGDDMADQPTPTGSSTAPPTSRDLPLALESAVNVTPMADFTFEGFLPQGTWATKVQGKLSYDHDAVSSVDTRMDMTVTAENLELTQRVVLTETEYIDGKEVPDPSRAPILLYARCPHTMGAVGVIADLARTTENVSASGRRYAGALVTRKAPAPLARQIRALHGDERTERETGDTSLSWVLVLDGRNRPKTFELSWHFPLDETTKLTARFTTTYRDWREGEVRAPGS
ncbi:serine/threonine-protein kinase [Nonomuraea sp. NPDC003804]|uniref:serine/threonine-protein kinase n=1 Tax=Nonomuraea sp. NPDC003804 TaxID=3154547 RepID=UPI0033A092AA